MKTRFRTLLACIGLIATGLLSGCETVKPFQKSYLNEEEMQLSARKVQTFEMNFESYREGAAGATGGKMGGGCGCN
ncbi:DUF4266 domain-containing protein [Pontibacter sp. KCTC 32443]|uniref:DUF4266 domain-containing protein n=1 Tax=Pontibacter TaxID=323449 RepID=UPI00164D102C|nr:MULTISPECIES: DUF4266 domain-containing protein [Pontibacter]MBC5772549.1 DUF4266 domain-containing protein [Pontibacter sp. KCTC 32443]